MLRKTLAYITVCLLFLGNLGCAALLGAAAGGSVIYGTKKKLSGKEKPVDIERANHGYPVFKSK